MIPKLARLQAFLNFKNADGQPQRLIHCQRLMQLLEDENYLMTSVRQHNSVIVSLRQQLFLAATNQQSSLEIDCYNFKNEVLPQWGLRVT